MIRDAASIVRSRLRQTQGLSAVITRGQDSCSAIVSFGRSELVAVSSKEFRIQSGVQDIFVKAADYQPTGISTKPEGGDRIVVTLPDGSLETFDVRPPAGQQCWQESGYIAELRVHCKKVAPIATTI